MSANLVKVTVNGLVIECTMTQAIDIIKSCGGTLIEKKEAKNAPKKLVEYTNQKGETKMVSEAQAKAWDTWKSRERLTLDEVKAIPAPEFNGKVDAYIKANPSTTAKEVKAKFPEMKGMTREALRERKVALGVREAR